MADPKLTIVIEQKGADGVVKSLKEIQKVGDTTYTKVLKDGKLVSESTKTITGAQKLNYNAVTALNQGYSFLKSIYQDIAGPMKEMLKLASEDQESVTKRNTAVMAHVGATQQDIDALEGQATSLQRAVGVGDDYVRSVQAQLAAQGVNTQEIQRATTATIGLSEVTGQDATAAAKSLARFMEGLTDKVRGTTISVGKNTDEQHRWLAVEKLSAIGMQELTNKAHELKGTQDRANQSWSEFKEAMGRSFTSQPVLNEVDKLIGGLNKVTDWINGHQSQIQMFFALLFGDEKSAQAAGDKMDRAARDRQREAEINKGRPFTRQERIIKRKEIGVKVLVHGNDPWGYTQGVETAAGTGASKRGFPEWWGSHGGDYTQVAQGFIGGGASGGFGALGSLAGNAVLPGIGGILGGLLGGGLGKLFGGHHKRQGETPAQPIYTSDMNLARLMTDLLNVTKYSLGARAGLGIDTTVRQLNMANARAGA